MPLNPRVQRDELKSFVGKKVMIGTRSYHYVSGRATRLIEQCTSLSATADVRALAASARAQAQAVAAE